MFRIHNSRIKRELPKRVESTADRWKNDGKMGKKKKEKKKKKKKKKKEGKRKKEGRLFFVDYIIQCFGTNDDCCKLR